MSTARRLSTKISPSLSPKLANSSSRLKPPPSTLQTACVLKVFISLSLSPQPWDKKALAKSSKLTANNYSNGSAKELALYSLTLDRGVSSPAPTPIFASKSIRMSI